MNMTSSNPQLSTVIADPASVEDAIASRFSVRQFLPKEVDREAIEKILDVAARAPSGVNTQPWEVYVLQGDSRNDLVAKVAAAHDAGFTDPEALTQYKEEYPYYPLKWFSPYIDRRRENGWGLYGLLGIQKGEREKMHKQHNRNFEFFGAPVGLMFTMNRNLERGSILDYGMFLQNIMIAARAYGLHTCPQAAWNQFASIILPHIGASSEEMLICGMALGYADTNAIVNSFHTPRVPAKDFTRWLR